MWRLAVVHFIANAVLLGCGYYWLGIGEGRASALAWSAVIAMLLVALTCATYGAAFAFFDSAERKKVSQAWTTAARNLLPTAAAALAIGGVYWLLAMWQDYSSDLAFTLASYLTLTFRKPVTPASVLKVFDAVLWLVRWVVLPVLLLPMLAAISTRGSRGFEGIGAGIRRWWYWLATPVLLLCAIWAPLKVLSWTPRSGSFAVEVLSFVVRAAVAYLLFGAAWLALAFATSAGKPRFTQSNTAVSP